MEKGSPGTRTPETVAVESQEPEPADVSPVNEVSEQKIRNETKLTIDEFIATHDLKVRTVSIHVMTRVLLFLKYILLALSFDEGGGFVSITKKNFSCCIF